MTHDFDSGHGAKPFRTPCTDYPHAKISPSSGFRRTASTMNGTTTYIGFLATRYNPLATRILGGSIGAGVLLPTDVKSDAHQGCISPGIFSGPPKRPMRILQ